MTFDPHRTTFGDLRRIALEQGKVGQVAIGTATEAWVAPWQQGSRIRKRGAKKEVVNRSLIAREDAMAAAAEARLYEGLPPIVRRSADARFQSLVNTLSQNALASIRATGQVHWPKSIEAELRLLGWKEGDPRLERIGTLEGAKRQIEDLARAFILRAGHQQDESDRHKVTLDWHGKANHRITVGTP